MFRDLRLAVRMLKKNAWVTAIAVLTLALGIGSTAAVFSLIQGVLLTPPPYRQPEQLVLIPATRTDGQAMQQQRAWPAAQWMEWMRDAKSFKSIAGYAWTFNFLVLPDGSESVEGMVVSKQFFHILGLQPMIGRDFLQSEVETSDASVIIIGYNLWQRRFSGDPKIAGKTVRISRWDKPLTIVGVMPPGVRFLPSPGDHGSRITTSTLPWIIGFPRCRILHV